MIIDFVYKKKKKTCFHDHADKCQPKSCNMVICIINLVGSREKTKLTYVTNGHLSFAWSYKAWQTLLRPGQIAFAHLIPDDHILNFF